MIKSPKGRKFLGYISPIYEQSVIMQAVMEAIGAEWDEAEKLADEVLAQLFPQTATWGLKYWEQQLGIPINETLPVEIRRANILSRLAMKHSMTRNRMEHIVNAYVPSKTAKVVEYIKAYIFAVLLPYGEPINFRELSKAVYDAKPAHLSARFFSMFDQDSYALITVKDIGNSLSPVSSFYAGMWPNKSVGSALQKNIQARPNVQTGYWTFPVSGMNAAGTIPMQTAVGAAKKKTVALNSYVSIGVGRYLRCGSFFAGQEVA